MPTPEELVASIERSGEQYASFIETQTDEAFHRRPALDEWSAAELTGHVAEFPITFSEQARRVAASPGLQIGRTLDDPGRLAAVEKLAGAGPAKAAGAVREGVRQAVATLRSIPSDRWTVKGKHPRLGELSISELVEHFIADHLQDHLEQAREAVGA